MSDLGARIRELRQSRSLTLEQVAEETGLSASFLSMLERGKVSISVDNLEKLARCYAVRMMHFFGDADANPVLIIRRDQMLENINARGSAPAMITLLANRPNARIEPLLVCIAPGQEESHFRQHEADTLLYVLEGQARLISEHGDTLDLEQGDLAYYTNFPHRRLANRSDANPLLLISITAPPTSSLDDLLNARQGSWVMPEEN